MKDEPDMTMEEAEKALIKMSLKDSFCIDREVWHHKYKGENQPRAEKFRITVCGSPIRQFERSTLRQTIKEVEKLVSKDTRNELQPLADFAGVTVKSLMIA